MNIASALHFLFRLGFGVAGVILVAVLAEKVVALSLLSVCGLQSISIGKPVSSIHDVRRLSVLLAATAAVLYYLAYCALGRKLDLIRSF